MEEGVDKQGEPLGTGEHEQAAEAVDGKDKISTPLADASESQPRDLIFVDAEDASARYAIPAAFGAYAKYMNIKLGNERFAEE